MTLPRLVGIRPLSILQRGWIQGLQGLSHSQVSRSFPGTFVRWLFIYIYTYIYYIYIYILYIYIHYVYVYPLGWVYIPGTFHWTIWNWKISALKSTCQSRFPFKTAVLRVPFGSCDFLTPDVAWKPSGYWYSRDSSALVMVGSQTWMLQY